MSRSMNWRSLFVAGILVFVGGDSFSGVVADGAELRKIGGGYSFTEGPAADSEGNVFFTDQSNDRIVKWSIDGTLSDWMSPCGRSNGLCFDAAGNLWACADEKNEMWRIESDKETTVVIKDYEG
ncbi:MAG: SMP-30/gluconolactonase/LRE family protein, partial [Candidatus Omnitrophica bacterium]|nr:SMP-30/gluconolactonase/LRE family protein [Candidatus Omnitrophota bacterium]